MNLYPRPTRKSAPPFTDLPVSAAYAYDYLAILYVKERAALNVTDEIHRVESALARQHGNHGEVLASATFQRLVDANQQVFEAIERAHHNEVSAREVQEINLKRFTAKRWLQEEFWPAHELSEVKTRIGVERRKL